MDGGTLDAGRSGGYSDAYERNRKQAGTWIALVGCKCNGLVESLKTRILKVEVAFEVLVKWVGRGPKVIV